MTDVKQILLQEAEQKMLKSELDSFAQKIKELYDSYITCNCFFKKQPMLLWVSLLNKVEELQSDSQNFNLNFILGFLYLRNENNDKAHQHLSMAIDLNPKSDICFALRSTLQQKLCEEIKDAEEGVSLNPSARNYFVLAGSLNEEHLDSLGYNTGFLNTHLVKDFERGIKCYQRAISLNNNFPCAYFNMGRRYEVIEYYVEAIESYLICIKLQPRHWCYYNLWFCFYQIKKYDLASHYIDMGMANNPNDYRFFFALGLQNDRLDNYEKAIENYQLYLSICSDPEWPVLVKLKNVENRYLYSFLNRANTEFDTANYLESIQNFEHYFFLGGTQTESTSNTYYTAVLYFKHPEKLINLANPNYIRLNGFRLSYNTKKHTKETLSPDEENIKKLIKYQRNIKIGFGGYQGLEIENIVKIDAKYILWCIINLHHFMINMNLFSSINFQTEINFYEAVEINLIKGIILAEKSKEMKEEREEEYGYGCYESSYDQWMIDEFDDDAETAYWNMD